MKNITARYFVTCFSCPDTFDIQNDAQVVEDKASVGMGGQQQYGRNDGSVYEWRNDARRRQSRRFGKWLEIYVY